MSAELGDLMAPMREVKACLREITEGQDDNCLSTPKQAELNCQRKQEAAREEQQTQFPGNAAGAARGGSKIG